MKIKHFFIGLGAFLLGSLAMANAAVTDVYFDDVGVDHEDFEAIHLLYNLDMIEGYAVEGSDTREYKPANSINRAEFLTLLLEGTGVADYEVYVSCFSDVPADEWYTTFICQAKARGWVDGHPDGSFKPSDTINLVEALKILGEVLEWELSEAGEDEEWYLPYLDFATEKNLLPVEGPATLMDRANVAVMIFRNIQVDVLELESFDETKMEELYESFAFSLDDALSGGTGTADDAADDAADDIADDAADDTTDGTADDTDTVDETVNVTISGDVSSIYAGNSHYVNIEVYVNAQDGLGLGGRDVSIAATTGIDIVNELSVTDMGGGYYEAQFSSTLSGDFTLGGFDEVTGEMATTTVTVEPGFFDHATIIDVIEPWESGVANVAYLKVMGQDQYDNILDYSSSGNNLSAITTMGSVTDVNYDNGVFTMEITADDWGAAEVDIVLEGSGVLVGESTVLSFYAITILADPVGVEEGAVAQVEIPYQIFMPESRGDLASYDFTVGYNPAVMSYLVLGDSDLSDAFSVISADVDADLGTIRIQASNDNVALDVAEVVDGGTLVFNVEGAGDSEMPVDEIVLVDTDDEEEDFVSAFQSSFEIIGGDPIMVAVVAKVKPTKEICIEAFIFPGAGITKVQAEADAKQATDIFALAGKNCNCKFFLKVVATVKEMTEADKATVDTNGNGSFDTAERANATTNFPATDAKCVPVYYFPKVTSGGDTVIGVTFPGPPQGMGIDKSKDGDGRTLAHELVHALSDGDAVDQGDADAGAQGANDADNLMNDQNIGDNMTKKQCELIEAKF